MDVTIRRILLERSTPGRAGPPISIDQALATAWAAMPDAEVTERLGSRRPVLTRSSSSQVVHPVWSRLEHSTLDLVHQAGNRGVHPYRHSGRLA